MGSKYAGVPPRRTGKQVVITRWVCECQQPPVLLATYDGDGTVNIKARDRYWTVKGEVWARCPMCGTEHYFDPAGRQPEALGA